MSQRVTIVIRACLSILTFAAIAAASQAGLRWH
jgi:hypothetical protein